MRPAVLLLVASGCAEEPAGGDSGVVDPWADFDAWNAPDPEPALTVDDVRQHLERVLIEPPRLAPVARAFVELMSHGDDVCPGNPTELIDVVIACTSDEGYTYQGIGGFHAEDFTDGTVTLNAWSLGACDFAIEDPQGQVMRGSGGLEHQDVTDPTGRVWRYALEGAFAFSGDGPPYLHDGMSGGFEAAIEERGSTFVTLVDGALAVGPTALYFDHVVFDRNACDNLPSGAMRVRDERGYWYTWTLDACSQCGDVAFFDASIGELCLDLRPLADTLALARDDRVDVP